MKQILLSLIVIIGLAGCWKDIPKDIPLTKDQVKEIISLTNSDYVYKNYPDNSKKDLFNYSFFHFRAFLSDEKEISNSAKAYQILADSGYGPALIELAKLYTMGLGVEKDGDKALSLLNKVEDTPDALYWKGMATISKKDKSIKPMAKLKKAMKYIEKAAFMGNVDASAFTYVYYCNAKDLKEKDRLYKAYYYWAFQIRSKDHMLENGKSFFDMLKDDDEAGPKKCKKDHTLDMALLNKAHQDLNKNPIGDYYLNSQGVGFNSDVARNYMLEKISRGF